MKDLDKVYDLLEKMYVEFTQKFEDMSNTLESHGSRLDSLEKGQHELKDLITEVDEKNDARYIALSNKIDEQSRSFQTMEVVTASNYVEIAKLKSVK